jgi:tRNA (guanine-N7-)-methyltransferase
MTVRRAPRLPIEELQPYLLEVAAPPFSPGPSPGPAVDPLDWRAVFGNDRPVEVEVGFGKGLFLSSAAQARPDVNFLGIEVERKYQLFTATRLARRGLSNVRLACGDARAFFRDRIPGASMLAVHVYFPDPWWKKRHRKRRLFTEEFAEQCTRVLAPKGRLHIASDVADYFAEISELLNRQAPLRPLPPPEAAEPRHDLDYLTHFERKYRQAGRPIERAVYERRA